MEPGGMKQKRSGSNNTKGMVKKAKGSQLGPVVDSDSNAEEDNESADFILVK